MRPLRVEVTGNPNGTVTATLKHLEADNVYSLTASNMAQMNMFPDQWREYLSAVQSKLDQMEPVELVPVGDDGEDTKEIVVTGGRG